MANEHGEQIRIVQETVAGKEITFAHVMGGPAPIIYQKLGLNPQLDYRSSAIGIMNMTPPESAVIASDIAVKRILCQETEQALADNDQKLTVLARLMTVLAYFIPFHARSQYRRCKAILVVGVS